MDRTGFEAGLRADGYLEVMDRRMDANAVNLEHAHEFDARLLVLEGEMTLDCGGEAHTYRAGDTFAITAGRRHAEHAGTAGVRYLAGRRYPKAAC
ncbi:MAG TPA: cupin domain-containing protein [Stellaceae bacterium]|jgi:quercetin dioxygenase-like cupin family protein